MFKSDDILAEANSLKVVVFMESKPLTDHFEQIVLTREQAKAMRDAILKSLHPEFDMGKEGDFDILCNDKVAVTLPDVLDEYEPEQIKALQEAA